MTIEFRSKTGKKVNIYGDGSFLFALYPGEIREYGLEDGAELEVSEAERIVEETVLPRAKRRLMNILIKGDRSEAELRRSLKTNLYDDETIEKAIRYIDSFHYIDETRAAESFVRSHIGDSSEKEIRFKLDQRGYVSEAVDAAFEAVEEDYPDHELNAAVYLLKKKIGMFFDFEDEDAPAKLEKAMLYLQRKGFSYGIIKQAVRETEKQE